MTTCITYGDKKYRAAAQLNLESAKVHGADNTILFGPSDIPLGFKIKNWRIYFGRTGKRLKWKGAGYWVWKPYIIRKTLSEMEEGDILIYSDGASVFVNDIDEIVSFLNEGSKDMLVFSLKQAEKCYTKRDAFVLMNADVAEYTDSRQRLATYLVFRNNDKSRKFVEEWYQNCLNYRIITDEKNRMGKGNYPEFIDHRNDQSVLSLLAKKNGIEEYRDPSQWGNNPETWPQDVIERSKYPQIWYSTRDRSITTMEQFKDRVPDPFGLVD